jgi:putative ABC transport system permease protein
MKIFLHELRLSLRISRKNLLFSIFSITGLALGITGLVLISLFLQREESFDKAHSRYHDIYRMNVLVKRDRSETNFALVPSSWPSILKDQNDEIESFTRMLIWNHQSLSSATSDFKTYVDPFMFADSTFFDLFDGYKIISGDRSKALAKPFSLALTRSMAKTFFGDADPIGQSLIFENKYDFKITAVYEDIDFPTHVNFKLLASYETLKYLTDLNPALERLQSPGFITSPTYLLLAKGADHTKLESRFPDFVGGHVSKDRVGILNPYLDPLSDIHYSEHRDFELGEKGNKLISNILFAVAILITIMALANFIFMTVANLFSRIAELNISKVYGMNGYFLLTKILSIPFLSITIASALALALLTILADTTLLVHARIIYAPIDTIVPLMVIWAVLITIATAIPALWLLKVNLNLDVLKSRTPINMNSMFFFKAFVIVEFSITIALVFALLVVSDQVEYLKEKDMGFDKGHLMVLPIPASELKYSSAIRSKFEQVPGISNLSFSNDYPGQQLFRYRVRPEGIEEELTNLSGLCADYNIINTLGLSIVNGRSFQNNASDSIEAVILNEAAVQLYGWDDAVGKKISINRFGGGRKEGIVVGVVKNFNFNSLKSPIQPLMLMIDDDTFKYIIVQYSGDPRYIASRLSVAWKSVLPEIPFDYVLVQDELAGQYQNETNYYRALFFFSSIAISLACIGLLGISLLSTIQRKKEVAIKLVLGASRRNVVTIAILQNLGSISLSFILGIPLSYWFIQDWLTAFPYRVDIGASSLIISFVIALAVSLLSVAYSIYQIMIQNPAVTLRRV